MNNTGNRGSRKIATDFTRELLFSYYEERAKEYDEVYLGKGPAISELSSEYITDTTGISQLLSRFGRGHVIDIACGTAFWLPFYGHNCTSVTLIDQSTAALAQCRKRIEGLGMRESTQIIRGDLFDLLLGPSTYDGAIVGFLISHFTTGEVEAFFRRLRKILKPAAELVIIDSVWSPVRSLHCEKEGFVERVLNDGRSFRIYKRYFEKTEFEFIFESQGFKVRYSYVGKVFIAAIATRVA